ncbi:MAG: hypothetical protein RLZZ126_484 [Pseudomonadota bacterium]
MKQMGKHKQLGGTLLGLVIGVVVGLALALGVAVYVTKVPVPFVNKGQTRTVEQDAAEAKKNQGWDPNAPLYGKPPKASASAPSASGAVGVASDAKAVADPKAAASAPTAGAAADAGRAKSSPAAADPFIYFIQAGAFRTVEDAESQRARLQLGGFEAKVTEREQSGRPIFRVRVGPFEQKDDADKAKARMDGTGLDTALVRVQRGTN